MNAVRYARQLEKQASDVEWFKTDPSEFCCPITGEIFKDPYIASDGLTYEREVVEHIIRKQERSPITGLC